MNVGELLDELRPYLASMSADILAKARTSVAVPTLQPGTVTEVSKDNGDCTVTPDAGGGVSITARSLVGLPAKNSRVMLLFQPPNGVFVVGYVSKYQNPRRVGGRWRRTAVQAINNTTVTAVVWDVEDSDSDQFGAAGSGTLTVPANIEGRILVTGNAFFAVPTGGARSFVQLTCSAYTDSPRTPITGAGESAAAVSSWFDVSPGDTIKLEVFHSNGVAANLARAVIEMWRVP